MATKKIRKDEFMFGTEAVTMKMTDKDTTFVNSVGNLIFKLDIPMTGAWSDRRVAKALLTLHKSIGVRNFSVALKPAKKPVPKAVKKEVKSDKIWAMVGDKGPSKVKRPRALERKACT